MLQVNVPFHQVSLKRAIQAWRCVHTKTVYILTSVLIKTECHHIIKIILKYYLMLRLDHVIHYLDHMIC